MFGLDGLFNAWGNLGSSMLGYLNANQDRATNEKIANENLAYQYKNLDYQKALQQMIFNREDTAIQRRKQDLLNAGLNPYAASMGNGAGAGAVVSTQAPHNDFKSTLSQDMAPSLSGLGKAFGSLGGIAGELMDTYNATQQMKQNAIYTKSMELQNKMLNLDYQDQRNNFLLDWKFSPDNGANNYPWTYENSDYFGGDKSFFAQTPKYRQREFELSNYSFQNELLKRQNDFYTADKIEGYIMDLINQAIGVSNSAKGWHSAKKPDRLQNYEDIKIPLRGGGSKNLRRYF